MKQYFTLMQNDAALQAFLTNDWPKLHPGETAPSLDAVKTQMWNDYALLWWSHSEGRARGSDGLYAASRCRSAVSSLDRSRREGPRIRVPDHAARSGAGAWEAVPRWGAIDFSIQSGDVMHFDDRYGLGKPFYDAFAALTATADADYTKAKADYEAAVKAEKEKRLQPQGSGSGSGTPTQQPGSGSVAPTPQCMGDSWSGE